MDMPKMLWSGLRYFLDGARRHKVLLGELSEQRAKGAWRVFGKQDPSKMPNAPFRKYQTSGFAFEAYSFAIYNAEKGVLTTLNNTPLNLNLQRTNKK